MSIAVIAEKPSVARDIARVIGARRRGEGFLHGEGHVVTWAVGHLVALAEPHQIEAGWKRWRKESLPMIPARWPLSVYERTRDRFEVIEQILSDPGTEGVICATDAGREGELIFRYIYEKAGCQLPVQRLWISSLTDAAIRAGLAALRPGSAFDPLADAARGRSRADWLVGMNLTRAYSLMTPGRAEGEVLSVGRVQTPTLAMLVARERSIRDFVPEDYKEVVVHFGQADACPAGPVDPGEAAPETCYEGTYFDPKRADAPADGADPGRGRGLGAEGVEQRARARIEAARLPAEGERARQIAERARNGEARISSVEGRQRRLPPPLLYDLTELQRHANRLYGYSASRTLEIAQTLYEQKKLISYPRTDGRHLTPDVAADLPAVVRAAASRFDASMIAPGSGARALGPRHVDAARVGDHHALIPTHNDPATRKLGTDEARIYDLIARRLLAAYHEDHLYSTTEVITTITTRGIAGVSSREERQTVVDHFRSRGSRVDRLGWRILDPRPSGRSGTSGRGAAVPQEAALPAWIREGILPRVHDARILDKRTRPPRAFTEATLLTAMETAGRTLDEKALSEAMRENGLGTPATRASIIETLLARGYVERSEKSLRATEKGIELIDRVHPDVKSPALTGRWEARLGAISRGEAPLAPFMREIEAWVREVVARVLTTRGGAAGPHVPAAGDGAGRSVPGRSGGGRGVPGRAADGRSTTTRLPDTPEALGRARPERSPTPPEALPALLAQTFGFERFRPHQREVCEHITRGDDLLLVMPTGAGKSLCYQLPGLARGGSTLVVSPLIALMEDQVAKLEAVGLRAERIHSGRARAESRQVCRAWLDGDLDFLFIAPERLGVTGFPELLARRRPGLIAIDEAHCISQWGHDFRPDYRMLGERLPLLRPAPIVALTATATPRVQRDILQQLGIPDARASIHGFRRANLAVEVVELPAGQRAPAAERVLKDRARRPAIVYAPTRKKAEQLATRLAKSMPCAVYHAGLAADQRDRVQGRFLAGELDVVVATIAFGMGIDKADVRTVIHTALPGSVEGYSQEIGRAGRDGRSSRAILMHGYADLKTHEWFLERDYPATALLERVHAALDGAPRPTEAVQQRLKGPGRPDAAAVARALDHLVIHGAAERTVDGHLRRRDGGADTWKRAYAAQREHKETQLTQMAEFARQPVCHMRALVHHFGDHADAGEACGICDVCAPDDCVALRFDRPTPTECQAMAQILKALRERDGQSTGRLHLQTFGDSVARTEYERLLATLARGGLVTVEGDAFESEGERITYRRAFLTPAGRETEERALGDLSVVQEGASQSATRRSPDRPRRSRASRSRSRRGRARGAARGRGAGDALAEAGAPAEVVAALKAWRLEKSRARRIPAYRILSDRVLLAVAADRPGDEAALASVPGIGPKLLRKYGREILALLAEI